MSRDEQQALWENFIALRDSLYVRYILQAIARRLDKQTSRLAAAGSWEDVLKIQGEINGLKAALAELNPQPPEEEQA